MAAHCYIPLRMGSEDFKADTAKTSFANLGGQAEAAAVEVLGGRRVLLHVLADVVNAHLQHHTLQIVGLELPRDAANALDSCRRLVHMLLILSVHICTADGMRRHVHSMAAGPSSWQPVFLDAFH